MARRIVLLFDGTWSKRRDHTNVARMRDCIATRGRDDPEQPCFYDAGVGTDGPWYDRITGGAFGKGLSENIQQGWAWLSHEHQPGDDIYVFGFSRGAYSARSLVGLIRKCGLLKQASKEKVKEAYALYRDKNVHPDAPAAVQFRATHSREVRVHFIGVWDTVGSLGIPLSAVPFSRDFYQWHDTELSKIVDYAYHAIAVDEHRTDFDVTVWSKLKPENVKVEQRWFAGAHSDVGGGQGGTLPNLALRWMQDVAESAGLVLKKKVQPGPRDHLGAIDRSFETFLFGIYRWFSKPHQRVFGQGVNEVVDPSVWQRWREDPSYRPSPLVGAPSGATVAAEAAPTDATAEP